MYPFTTQDSGAGLGSLVSVAEKICGILNTPVSKANGHVVIMGSSCEMNTLATELIKRLMIMHFVMLGWSVEGISAEVEVHFD